MENIASTEDSNGTHDGAELSCFYARLENEFFNKLNLPRNKLLRQAAIFIKSLGSDERWWVQLALLLRSFVNWVARKKREDNSLRDMWFLNGSGTNRKGESKRYPIRFMRPELVESYDVRIFRKGIEYKGAENFNKKGQDLFGTWDFMLVKLFDSRFTIRRSLVESADGKNFVKGFVIRSRPAFCDEPPRPGDYEPLSQKDIRIARKRCETSSDESGKPCCAREACMSMKWTNAREMIIEQRVFKASGDGHEIPVESRPNTINPDGKCKYMKLSNHRIVIAQEEHLAEPVCCRTMLIYILAKAYTYKLEELLDMLSDKALFKEHNIVTTLWAWFCGMFPFFPIGPIHSINKLYKDVVKFKNQYFFSIPISLHRAEDLPKAWDDLYSFYRIKTISDEINLKINDLTLLSRNAHASVITCYMFIMALLGVLIKADVSIMAFFSAFIGWFQ